MNNNTSIAILALFFCTVSAFAASKKAMTKSSKASQPASIYPRGCEITGFGFNQTFLMLNESGEQTLYLIQNHSDKTIELEHQETRDVFMSPTMKAKIEPLHWAAFASDVAHTFFKCFSGSGENASIVSCSDVIDICQYPRVKFATSNMGNYWVSTNKPQVQIIRDAIAKGILLRW